MRIAILLFIFSLSTRAYSIDCDTSHGSDSAFGFISQFVEWYKASKTAIKLDSGLISDWDGKDWPCPGPGPFLATFKKGSKKFQFLAIDHVLPPVKTDESELAVIEREIRKFNPEQITIETTFPPGGAISPTMSAQMAQGCRNGSNYICSEPQFVLEIASKLGARVYAGEPNASDTFRAIEQKFSNEDVYAFESTRVMRLLLLKQVPRENWPKEFMILVRQDISEEYGPWSYENYQRWITKNINSAARVEDVNLSWLEPRADSGASRMQQISYVGDSTRDPHILSTIEKSLNQTNHSMAVYGSGHFLSQRKALESALGPATIQCLK